MSQGKIKVQYFDCIIPCSTKYFKNHQGIFFYFFFNLPNPFNFLPYRTTLSKYLYYVEGQVIPCLRGILNIIFLTSLNHIPFCFIVLLLN